MVYIYPSSFKIWPLDGIESCRKSTIANLGSIGTIQSDLRSSICGALNPPIGQILNELGYKGKALSIVVDASDELKIA